MPTIVSAVVVLVVVFFGPRAVPFRVIVAIIVLVVVIISVLILINLSIVNIINLSTA
jgi:hypothetical protein